MSQLSRLGCACAMLLSMTGCSATGEQHITVWPVQPPPAAPAHRGDAATLSDFTRRLDNYLAVQRGLAKPSPDLNATKDPVESKVAEDDLAAKIRVERWNAHQGDIFTPQVASLFRRLMNDELTGAEAETKGNSRDDHGDLILKVNAKYPTTEPEPTMPSNILANLPRLPGDVEYRIVDGHLVLRDVDANIIVDFIPNAVPS